MNKIFKSRIVFSLALMAFMGLFFNSCQKEANEVAPKADTEILEHSRTITAFDKSGENSADIVLTTNDLSLLNKYSAENFELIPIMENEDAATVISNFYGNTQSNDNEEEDTTVEEEDTTTPNFVIEVQNVNKAAAVKAVSITFKHPESGDDRAWKYKTHKSYNDCMFIQRTSAWHRVYYGLEYRASSTSGYTTDTARYKKLNNNEVYTKCITSYQLVLDVKYKKTSHYTCYFY